MGLLGLLLRDGLNHMLNALVVHISVPIGLALVAKVYLNF